ncbi:MULTISPECIES: tonB-system energizer ExbB [Rhizobiaceae]|uniref:Biopolymer transport protein ExbB n=1 Tax=Aliirhizobium cellulosilyticum TaxID=393664 RepID=A0A7W6S8G2_9HYPH|nr:biopolymer transport protein ExbB [Rhizobium cellulosilyticum]MBB4412643.1 biopolymer transport protein ExbB [Rhizobium cellulosilyticum]MBB4447275.1 biopolymer transport protein ExbB [Rhizobium cellulosilyticum]
MSAALVPAVAGNRHLGKVAKQLGMTAATLALLSAMAMAQIPAPAPQAQTTSQADSAQQQAPASSAAPTTGRTAPATTPATTPTAPSAPAENAAPASPAAPAASTATEGAPAAQAPAQSAQPAPSTETTAPGVSQPAQAQAAPQETVTDLVPAEEETPVLTIPHDLSPWGMFMAADWVVKSVMIGLAIASLATWTVWLVKTLELAGARTRAGRIIKIIRNSRTLAEAVDASAGRGGPAAYMLQAAAEEIKMSADALDHVEGDGVKERVGSSLSRIEAFAGRRIARGTGILATIGSVAPFVGLFGTVWGIMNSFIGISETQTTNLAVVAPGIAEALLATAIGLVAAIPAVVIYNLFARSVTGYRALLADAASGVERLVSRDLDFRKVPPGGRKATPMSLMAGE